MAYDVVPSPNYPTPNYQTFGSDLGNLFGDYQGAQQSQIALQQQRMKLAQAEAVKKVAPFLPNGQPNYAGQIGALMGAGDTGAMGSLGPLATEAQGGTVSGLFSGAQTPAPGPGVGPNGPTAPAQPTGDVPPASAANSSATRPQTAAPNQGPFGNISGTATSGTTIADMTGKAIPDPDKSKMVAGLIARGVGADPTSPLTPDQAARVQKALAGYSQRNPGVASWQDVQRDNAQGTANLPRVAAEGAAAGGASGSTDNLVGQIKKGIAGVESGGKYDAVGPVTASGDRAYGKYQVMGENVGPWTKEALGYAMTPEQFLKNQGAQEAVASTKIQELLAKGNSPQDVASEWLTGKPLAQGANLRDQNGTSGAQYAASVTRGIPGGATAAGGGSGGGQPIVPQVPLPRGYTDPQKAILAIDQETARLAASPNPGDRRQIQALQDWRERIASSTAPLTVSPTQTIVDPATGAIKYQGAFASGAGTMAPDAVENAAQVYVDSGKLPPRMGSGMQGTANMNAVLGKAAQIMEEQGITPDSLAQRWQSFGAQGAGQSLLAKRTASLELAENEAKALIPAVRDAAANVKSTDYPDINKVIQAGLMHSGDPNVVRLGIAVESLAQTYARVLSPSGAPTAADKANAHEIIAKYWSQGQIGAALDQMTKEIDRAKASLNTTRKEMGASPLKEDDSPAAASPKSGASGPLPSGTYTYDPKTGQLIPSK